MLPSKGGGHAEAAGCGARMWRLRWLGPWRWRRLAAQAEPPARSLSSCRARVQQRRVSEVQRLQGHDCRVGNKVLGVNTGVEGGGTALGEGDEKGRWKTSRQVDTQGAGLDGDRRRQEGPLETLRPPRLGSGAAPSLPHPVPSAPPAASPPNQAALRDGGHPPCPRGGARVVSPTLSPS